MSRFYVDFSLANGESYTLPETVVRHINVLRLHPNSQIELFNGDGNNYLAQINELSRKQVTVSILGLSPANNSSKIAITLAMSIIAADKFDLVIQKAVELGVGKIIPVYCQRTQRFKLDKLSSRIEHWHKIIIAASEQCGRAELAILEEPIEFPELMSSYPDTGKFILSPHHGNIYVSSNKNNNSNRKILLVGPEGGFTSEEVELAISSGYRPLMLGQRILRAETAAIAGMSYLHTCCGDFKF